MSRLGAFLGSPVVFQPLERELAPVAKYLCGKVLNAGCGERDVSGYLLGHGATSVENCDLSPALPDAIACELSKIPRPASTYDSALCNAVLEHVRAPTDVLTELHRVLKPGGVLVIGVPFLQPFHAVPMDFQRYTKDGLVELATRTGFEVVELLPVHSVAQTVAWIVWACLREKRRHIAMALLWLPFRLWTGLFQRTDRRLLENANSYQLVLRKPGSH